MRPRFLMSVAWLVCTVLFIYPVTIANARRLPEVQTSSIFNVNDYGVIADGVTDDSAAFLEAWGAACASSGDVSLLIPPGNYFLNPIKFRGPCPNVTTLTLYQEGHLKASTNLSKYIQGNDWVEFGDIDGLRITGGGTFNGQGSTSWSYDQCPDKKYCQVLPTSVKFVNVNNTAVHGMNSVNPKFFHIGILQCHHFHASNMHITAPKDSPNTDGIHIERSSRVIIHDAFIGTGDDCISIGQGNGEILIQNITCGPGHGISIGSLGKYPNEGNVKNILVRDITLTDTMNGVRIKTWQDSPSSSSATNITFEYIQMKNVSNPIIIDQTYCPNNLCANDSVPSRVSISNVYFRVINGTSASPVAVKLNCSPGTPCRNIHLDDVVLQHVTKKPSTAYCAFADVHFSAPMLPLPCNS